MTTATFRVRRDEPGSYAVFRGPERVGDVIRDGRPGVDNYPWTWSVSVAPFGSGPADSKRTAIAKLIAHITRKGGESK